MSVNILEAARGAVKNFQFTNAHFDLIGAAGAVMAYMADSQSVWTRGLQGFAIAALADRGIMALGGLQIKGNQVLGLQSNASAVFEEAVLHPYLDTVKGTIAFIFRFAISCSMGITAIRAIRHPGDLKTMDKVDSLVGIAWAMGREIVIQKVNDKRSLRFGMISNSLLYGLGQAHKFPNHFFYKFASSFIFRMICGASALDSKIWWRTEKIRWIPPFVVYMLFNTSRSFSL